MRCYFKILQHLKWLLFNYCKSCGNNILPELRPARLCFYENNGYCPSHHSKLLQIAIVLCRYFLAFTLRKTAIETQLLSCQKCIHTHPYTFSQTASLSPDQLGDESTDILPRGPCSTCSLYPSSLESLRLLALTLDDFQTLHQHMGCLSGDCFVHTDDFSSTRFNTRRLSRRLSWTTKSSLVFWTQYCCTILISHIWIVTDAAREEH